MTATIDRGRLAVLKAREDELFVARHPRSRELFERAQAHMLDGVPMNWMTRWSSPFPPYVAAASGARFTCVDGHEYVDFCLGDTGAMTGHSPEASVAAIAAQAARGITTMLPTEDSLWVAGETLPGASACSTGSWRSPRPTPTASRCASRGTSPGGPRSSSTTTATTAR